jgi:hypothetical protein
MKISQYNILKSYNSQGISSQTRNENTPNNTIRYQLNLRNLVR